MSDSPWAHYGTPDPEYATLFASLPPMNFPFEVEAARKAHKEMIEPLVIGQFKPTAPDRAYTIFVFMGSAGSCFLFFCSIKVQS